MTDPVLVPGPRDELETPPARNGADGAPSIAPKRRGRPPGSTNKRGPRKVDLTDKIAGYLTIMNFGFMFAPDAYKGDALDEAEITLLAKSLNGYAQENATVYRYLAAVMDGKGSASLTLALAVATIGTRRLARHGVLPAGIDSAVGSVASVLTGGVTLQPMPAPVEPSDAVDTPTFS